MILHYVKWFICKHSWTWTSHFNTWNIKIWKLFPFVISVDVHEICYKIIPGEKKFQYIFDSILMFSHLNYLNLLNNLWWVQNCTIAWKTNILILYIHIIKTNILKQSRGRARTIKYYLKWGIIEYNTKERTKKSNQLSLIHVPNDFFLLSFLVIMHILICFVLNWPLKSKEW